MAAASPLPIRSLGATLRDVALLCVMAQACSNAPFCATLDTVAMQLTLQNVGVWCNDRNMSEQPQHDIALDFDLADRMRKSLRVSDISVQTMAEYLDVNRNTVGRWINGEREPKLQTLRLWAMRTAVPLEWLKSGELNEKTPSPDGEGVLIEPPAGIEPATFSLQLVHFDQESIAA